MNQMRNISSDLLRCITEEIYCPASRYQQKGKSKMNTSYGFNKSSINSTTVNSNVTTTDNSAAYSTQSLVLIFAFFLILFIGTIGNSLVCYFFGWKRRGHWTVPDRLFLYLGIVDLLSSLLNPLLFIYFEFTKYSRWDFGTVGCKLLVPLAPISTTLSSFLIQIIAVDRYFVILSPFGRRYSSKSINYCVLLAVALSFSLYWYYIWMLQVPGIGGTCRILDITDERYSIPTVCCTLLQDVTFIPVMLFTNISIARKLSSDKDSNILGQVTRKQQNHKKLFRMLMVIACVFLLLTLPRDILQLSFTFSWMFPPGIAYNDNLRKANAVVKIMSTANSCANVFIYSKMHKNFRISIIRIFCCCTICNQHQQQQQYGQEIPMLEERDTGKTANVVINSNDSQGTSHHQPTYIPQ